MIVRSGPLNRSQELTWLQLSRSSDRKQPPAHRLTWDLSAGVDVAAAVGAVHDLIAVHEILRTIFVLGPNGLPMQMVFEPDGFQFLVTVSELQGSADEVRDAESKTALVADYAAVRFPWAMTMRVAGGQVRQVDVMFEHLISDAIGIQQWECQFRQLCAGEILRAPRFQPLDRQSREHATPRSPRSTAFVQQVVEQAAQTIVPPSAGDIAESRFVEVVAVYTDCLPAVDLVCQKHGVTRPAVISFVLCWLLARFGRLPAIHMALQAHNRGREDNGIDCCVTAPTALIKVDPSASCQAGLTEAYNSILLAIRHDAGTEVRYGDLMMTAAANRGIPPLQPFLFDFRGDVHGSKNVESAIYRPSPSVHKVVHPRNAAPYNLRVAAQVGNGFRLNYTQWGATEDHDVALSVTTDTGFLPPSALHAMLDAFPRALAHLIDDADSVLSDLDRFLPATCAATSHSLVQNCWLRLADLNTLVSRCTAVRAAHISVTGEVVTARLRLSHGATGFDVHEHVLAGLAEHPGTCAPHHYRWVNDDAEGPGHEEKELLYSPLHDKLVIRADTLTQKALCTAISQAHPGKSFDNIALTYAQAGGELIRFSAVMDNLRRAGWRGIASRHVLTPLTLRLIASDLKASEW